MSDEKEKLGERFAEAVSATDFLTERLSARMELFRRTAATLRKSKNHDLVVALEADVSILNLCKDIVDNQRLQNDVIAELRRELQAVQEELSPHRPLPGKSPLAPKGPPA